MNRPGYSPESSQGPGSVSELNQNSEISWLLDINQLNSDRLVPLQVFDNSSEVESSDIESPFERTLDGELTGKLLQSYSKDRISALAATSKSNDNGKSNNLSKNKIHLGRHSSRTDSPYLQNMIPKQLRNKNSVVKLGKSSGNMKLSNSSSLLSNSKVLSDFQPPKTPFDGMGQEEKKLERKLANEVIIDKNNFSVPTLPKHTVFEDFRKQRHRSRDQKRIVMDIVKSRGVTGINPVRNPRGMSASVVSSVSAMSMDSFALRDTRNSNNSTTSFNDEEISKTINHGNLEPLYALMREEVELRKVITDHVEGKLVFPSTRKDRPMSPVISLSASLGASSADLFNQVIPRPIVSTRDARKVMLEQSSLIPLPINFQDLDNLRHFENPPPELWITARVVYVLFFSFFECMAKILDLCPSLDDSNLLDSRSLGPSWAPSNLWEVIWLQKKLHRLDLASLKSQFFWDLLRDLFCYEEDFLAALKTIECGGTTTNTVLPLEPKNDISYFDVFPEESLIILCEITKSSLFRVSSLVHFCPSGSKLCSWGRRVVASIYSHTLKNLNKGKSSTTNLLTHGRSNAEINNLPEPLLHSSGSILSPSSFPDSIPIQRMEQILRYQTPHRLEQSSLSSFVVCLPPRQPKYTGFYVLPNLARIYEIADYLIFNANRHQRALIRSDSRMVEDEVFLPPFASPLHRIQVFPPPGMTQGGAMNNSSTIAAAGGVNSGNNSPLRCKEGEESYPSHTQGNFQCGKPWKKFHIHQEKIPEQQSPWKYNGNAAWNWIRHSMKASVVILPLPQAVEAPEEDGLQDRSDILWSSSLGTRAIDLVFHRYAPGSAFHNGSDGIGGFHSTISPSFDIDVNYPNKSSAITPASNGHSGLNSTVPSGLASAASSKSPSRAVSQSLLTSSQVSVAEIPLEQSHPHPHSQLPQPQSQPSNAHEDKESSAKTVGSCELKTDDPSKEISSTSHGDGNQALSSASLGISTSKFIGLSQSSGEKSAFPSSRDSIRTPPSSSSSLPQSPISRHNHHSHGESCPLTLILAPGGNLPMTSDGFALHDHRLIKPSKFLVFISDSKSSRRAYEAVLRLAKSCDTIELVHIPLPSMNDILAVADVLRCSLNAKDSPFNILYDLQTRMKHRQDNICSLYKELGMNVRIADDVELVYVMDLFSRVVDTEDAEILMCSVIERMFHFLRSCGDSFHYVFFGSTLEDIELIARVNIDSLIHDYKIAFRDLGKNSFASVLVREAALCADLCSCLALVA